VSADDTAGQATLINVFIIPNDKEDEFLENWHRTSAVFQQDGGLIEAHLHRNAGVGNQTFQFINIARWTSAEAWRSAHEAYPPTEYSVEGVVGHPAIYSPVADIYGVGHTPDDAAGRAWLKAGA
jgi:hypothetical protein